jgi:hypothetical protein
VVAAIAAHTGAGTDDEEIAVGLATQSLRYQIVPQAVRLSFQGDTVLVEQSVVHAAGGTLPRLPLAGPDRNVKPQTLAQQPGHRHLVRVARNNGQHPNRNARRHQPADGKEIIGVVTQVCFNDQFHHQLPSLPGPVLWMTGG